MYWPTVFGPEYYKKDFSAFNQSGSSLRIFEDKPVGYTPSAGYCISVTIDCIFGDPKPKVSA